MFRKTTELESKLEKTKIEEDRHYREKIANAELTKQKQIKNTIFIVAGIVLLLLLFSYRNYKQKEKANVEITEKKKIIEHKNKDILDSINYSKRLQDAVLMSKEEVKTILPRSFLVYLPKEIVSGDFYFIEKDERGNTHIVLAESNKHGVPGAFISIAGNNILKQAIKEKSLLEPGQILDFLNKELKAFLKHEENTGINISYCVINSAHNEVRYAGANLPVFVSSAATKQNTELIPEDQAIGLTNKINYKTQSLKIEKGDMLYLFSNGFTAQLNNKGEEFGKARFAQLLTEENISEQQIINTFNNWKTSVEQTDDICIIGVRL